MDPESCSGSRQPECGTQNPSLEIESKSTPKKKLEPVRLGDLNPSLTCVICTGYLISAVTIVECLHSFCRSCIIRYLKENLHQACPICDMPLHKAKPILSLRPDKTLQDIVYKLVPGLYARELNQRRRYYFSAGLSNGLMGQEVGELEEEDDMLAEHENGAHFYAPDEKISLSLEYDMGQGMNNSDDGVKPESPVTLTGNSACQNGDGEGPYQRRYLLCPASMTVNHLKKFIHTKYRLSEKLYSVEIIYHDELLEESLKLMDIAYVFSWRRNNPMRLFYRIGKKKIQRHSIQRSESAGKEPAKMAKVSPRLQNHDSAIAVSSTVSTDNKAEVTQLDETKMQTSDSGSLNTQIEHNQSQRQVMSQSVQENGVKTDPNAPTQCNTNQYANKQQQQQHQQHQSTTSALRNVRISTNRISFHNPNTQTCTPSISATQSTSSSSNVCSSNSITLPKIRLPMPAITAQQVHQQIQSQSSTKSALITQTPRHQMPSQQKPSGQPSYSINESNNNLKRKGGPTSQCHVPEKRPTPHVTATPRPPIGSYYKSQNNHNPGSYPSVSSSLNNTSAGNSTGTKFHMRNILGSSSPPPTSIKVSAGGSISTGSGSTLVDVKTTEKLHAVPTTRGITIVREPAALMSHVTSVGTNSDGTKMTCSVGIGPSVPIKSLVKAKAKANGAVTAATVSGPKVIQTPLKPSSKSIEAFKHYFSSQNQSSKSSRPDSVVGGKSMTATEKVQQYLDKSQPPISAASHSHANNMSSISAHCNSSVQSTSGKSSPTKGVGGGSLDRIVANLTKNKNSSCNQDTPSASSAVSQGIKSPKIDGNRSPLASPKMSPKSSSAQELSDNKVTTSMSPNYHSAPCGSPRSAMSSPSHRPPSTGNLVIRISTKGSEMTCTTTSPVLRSPPHPSSNTSTGGNSSHPASPLVGSKSPPSISTTHAAAISTQNLSPKAYQSSKASPRNVSPKPKISPLSPSTSKNDQNGTCTNHRAKLKVNEDGHSRHNEMDSQEELHERESEKDEDEGQLVVDIACQSDDDEDELEMSHDVATGTGTVTPSGTATSTSSATSTTTTTTPNSEVGRPTSDTPTSQPALVIDISSDNIADNK